MKFTFSGLTEGQFLEPRGAQKNVTGSLLNELCFEGIRTHERPLNGTELHPQRDHTSSP